MKVILTQDIKGVGKKDEVINASEKPTFEKTIKAGFEIGRDIIGTMANTLILAYIGSSLSCTLLTVSYSGSLTYLFNREMIVVEMLQALVRKPWDIPCNTTYNIYKCIFIPKT